MSLSGNRSVAFIPRSRRPGLRGMAVFSRGAGGDEAGRGAARGDSASDDSATDDSPRGDSATDDPAAGDSAADDSAGGSAGPNASLVPCWAGISTSGDPPRPNPP